MSFILLWLSYIRFYFAEILKIMEVYLIFYSDLWTFWPLSCFNHDHLPIPSIFSLHQSLLSFSDDIHLPASNSFILHVDFPQSEPVFSLEISIDHQPALPLPPLEIILIFFLAEVVFKLIVVTILVTMMHPYEIIVSSIIVEIIV